MFKRFFRWALRERQIGVDPTVRMQAARQPLRVPKTLTQAQVEALLDAPDLDTALGLRDRAMLELMYASGCVSELVTLKTWNVGMNEGYCGSWARRQGAPGALWPGGAAVARATCAMRAHHPGRTANRRPVRDGARGSGMTRVMFWMIVKKYALVVSIHHALVTAYLAPCLCDAFAQPRR